MIIGAISGFLSAWMLPRPLISFRPVPGLSLVVAPLLSGVVMSQYGRWRGQQGRDVSPLATFAGGGLAAFAFALVRYLMIGLP